MESNFVPQGKIFVGGISKETTEEKLTQHFGRYGEVVKSEIIKFRETGLSKGFGFVTFADSSVINQILEDQQIILERTVDVKLAIPKGQSRQHQLFLECQQIQGHVIETSRINRRKIFVGGLPLDLSEEDYRSFFERFGRIEDAKIIFNRGTNTPRGFGFVTYDSEEAVTNVLQHRFYWLNGKYVEVKKAEPREWRVMDASNYYSYEMWPIYDCHGIYAPHYWPNHTMVSSWTIPFNHLGTNVPVPQPVPVMVPYFMPRYPVNSHDPVHNQVNHDRGSSEVSSTFAQNSSDIEYQMAVINEGNNDNDWGSQFHNSVSHEGNDQDCNNIELQLAAKGSPGATGSAKPLETEADNDEKDQSLKDPQVKTKAENGGEDLSMKILQVNAEANKGEKEHCVKISQDNADANNGEDDTFKV